MTIRSSLAKAKSRFAAGLLCLSATGFIPFEAPAQETQAEAIVCLAKTDRTGGRMRFIVREANAGKFEQAGFQRIDCPASPDEAIAAQEARCTRLRAHPAEGKEIILKLYGLSIDDMCAATDAWVSSRRPGANE